jgi:hypothetical protein
MEQSDHSAWDSSLDRSILDLSEHLTLDASYYFNEDAAFIDVSENVFGRGANEAAK